MRWERTSSSRRDICSAVRRQLKPPHPLEAALPQLLAEVGIRQHPVHRVRQLDGVVGIHADGRVAAHFRQGRGARGDHRRAAGHGLEHGQAEALPERGQHEAGRARVEVPERARACVALKAHDVGEAERLDPLAHRPRIRGLALAADDEPRAAVPPPQDGEGVEQVQQVLVGQEIAHVEDVARPRPAIGAAEISVDAVRVGVVARVDHPDPLGRDPVALDDVEPGAARVRHDDPRALEHARHQRAEVVLLPRILRGKEQRQQIVHDGDLGHGRAQDGLGDGIEQGADARPLSAEAKRGLHPDQAREMPAQPALGPREAGGGKDVRAKAAERVRARRVDGEVVADGVERADQVDRVEPEAGRAVAEDGCVDADAARPTARPPPPQRALPAERAVIDLDGPVDHGSDREVLEHALAARVAHLAPARGVGDEPGDRPPRGPRCPRPARGARSRPGPRRRGGRARRWRRWGGSRSWPRAAPAAVPP